MKRNILNTLLLIMVMASAVQAMAQSVKVIADPYVVQGHNFTVTFRVTNAEGSVQNGPNLKNCQLLYGPGISTIQSVQYINGQMSSSTIHDYSFTYRATAAGRVTIPSVSINASGKTLKSQPMTFEVLPPDRSSQQQHQQAPDYPDPGYGSQRSNAPTIRPNDLIVTVTMSKNNIYEKEAVVATIKVYTKHNITSFRATTLPVFEGFLSEELPVTNDQVKIEHFRGENYYSAVLKRCLLYPQKSGKLTINSGQYDVTLETYEEIYQGFYVTRRPVRKSITTTSNSLTVAVNALPQPQPAGFNGAVGKFDVTTTLEPQQLRTNEAATYTVDIKGTGNLKHLTIPDVSFPTGVELYTPESQSDASFNGHDMQGSFTATYTLVPQNEGALTIPGWDFIYFDPSTGKYVTIPIAGYDRKVVRGSAASQTTAQQEVAKMTDIEHIVQLSEKDLSKEHKRVFGSLAYILCYIVIMAILLTAVIVYRRNINLRADIEGRKTARASRVANRRLREARKAMLAHSNDAFYRILAKALWGYLSDKLRIPASALTRDNIQEKLLAGGTSEELVARTIAILDDCEMARFTPSHSDTEVSELYNRAAAVIKDIESGRKNNSNDTKPQNPEGFQEPEPDNNTDTSLMVPRMEDDNAGNTAEQHDTTQVGTNARANVDDDDFTRIIKND